MNISIAASATMMINWYFTISYSITLRSPITETINMASFHHRIIDPSTSFQHILIPTIHYILLIQFLIANHWLSLFDSLV